MRTHSRGLGSGGGLGGEAPPASEAALCSVPRVWLELRLMLGYLEGEIIHY